MRDREQVLVYYTCVEVLSIGRCQQMWSEVTISRSQVNWFLLELKRRMNCKFEKCGHSWQLFFFVMWCGNFKNGWWILEPFHEPEMFFFSSWGTKEVIWKWVNVRTLYVSQYPSWWFLFDCVIFVCFCFVDKFAMIRPECSDIQYIYDITYTDTVLFIYVHFVWS